MLRERLGWRLFVVLLRGGRFGRSPVQGGAGAVSCRPPRKARSSSSNWRASALVVSRRSTWARSFGCELVVEIGADQNFLFGVIHIRYTNILLRGAGRRLIDHSVTKTPFNCSRSSMRARVQSAAHGTHRQVEHLGDGFRTDGRQFREAPGRCGNLRPRYGALLARGLPVRGVGWVLKVRHRGPDGFVAGLFAMLVDGDGWFFCVAGGWRPCSRQSGTTKCKTRLDRWKECSFYICLDKGILAHVATIFRGTGYMDQHVV